jgi:YD repeat-containing protein
VASPSPGQTVIGRAAHGGKNNGPQKNQCGVGNPILSGTGNKFQQEPIWRVGRELDLLLTYNYNDNQITSFGRRWRSPFDRAIQVDDDGSTVVFRQDGKALRFLKSTGMWVTDADTNDTLQELLDAGAKRIGWQYRVAEDDSLESYNANGKLTSMLQRDGVLISLQYSDGTSGTGGGVYIDDSGNPLNNNTLAAGLLIKVSNSFGGTIRFRYDTRNKISQAIGPIGAVYQFNYDAYLNLGSVTFPDGKKRTYWYNEQDKTSNTDLRSALTGITDENGIRFATWNYDAEGHAISSEHAGGVEKYSIDYANPTVQSIVTDPLGTTRTYNFQMVLGVVQYTGQSQPGGAGCGAASSAVAYDANGNVASRTDFNGNVTKYTYDLSRNLETSRTEGFGTPQARTITTQWHATYRLPVKIAEPNRLTTNAYDASSGNLLSKSIQATNDATGAQGVSATAVGVARTWSYTYNSVGQVLTATGPRTDVLDKTTYTYDAQGNLATVMNAANHLTVLSNYDANGRVGWIVDPNGLTTDLVYHPRGWLSSKTVSGAGGGSETTSYDYDGVGQMTKATMPDGSAIFYTYDPAHRLTNIADSLGNSMTYTLDAMGNRVNEQVKDPNGTLARQTSRIYDALNRLQQVTGGTQ